MGITIKRNLVYVGIAVLSCLQLVCWCIPTFAEEISAGGHFDDLVRSLKEGDTYVRSDAARDLGDLGDARAVAPLHTALKDESWEVRLNAAFALGKLGDVRGVEFLKTVLAESDRYIAKNAAYTLLKLEDPRGEQAVVELLTEGGFALRSTQAKIAFFLVSNDDPHLEKLLKPSVTKPLKKVLQKIVSALKRSLSHPDPNIRRMAIDGLGDLADSPFVSIVGTSYSGHCELHTCCEPKIRMAKCYSRSIGLSQARMHQKL